MKRRRDARSTDDGARFTDDGDVAELARKRTRIARDIENKVRAMGVGIAFEDLNESLDRARTAHGRHSARCLTDAVTNKLVTGTWTAIYAEDQTPLGSALFDITCKPDARFHPLCLIVSEIPAEAKQLTNELDIETGFLPVPQGPDEDVTWASTAGSTKAFVRCGKEHSCTGYHALTGSLDTSLVQSHESSLGPTGPMSMYGFANKRRGRAIADIVFLTYRSDDVEHQVVRALGISPPLARMIAGFACAGVDPQVLSLEQVEASL